PGYPGSVFEHLDVQWCTDIRQPVPVRRRAEYPSKAGVLTEIVLGNPVAEKHDCTLCIAPLAHPDHAVKPGLVCRLGPENGIGVRLGARGGDFILGRPDTPKSRTHE